MRIQSIILFSLLQSFVNAQDLTGTWEGNFVKGTIGLHQTSRMKLELVEVEGRIYGIFSLFPVDTKASDQPNVIYSVEGKRGPDAGSRFALFKGRILESTVPELSKDFHQFTLQYSKNEKEVLNGKWFFELEPVNSRERGGGSLNIKKVNKQVESEELQLRLKEKEILQKLEKKSG